MNLAERLRLYVISEPKCGDVVEQLRAAMEGGATAVQLRMKNVPDRLLLEKAREIRKISEDYGALFMVDDRVDIALASRADGVHLGSDDMLVRIAREIAPNIIIGRTVRSVEDAKDALQQGCAGFVGASFGAGQRRLGGHQPALDGGFEHGGAVALQVALDAAQALFSRVQLGEEFLDFGDDAALFG